ncbi:Uu.00g107450.m01.CDS01 [Anthostomella pinea]|uniref:Uu.00g107450.m01.CDS01 n=1 Tax=Anthostomella pinea TaxID=933095 RepID=A0AAI8VE75_9PEZI|nr:Uu.00g107450.m01.CDS01 [Anthostomella pinea]
MLHGGCTQARTRGIVSFFLGFLLCYALAAAYLSSTCYRDPSSVFFRPEHARVLSYSSFRIAEATEFGDRAALHPPPKSTNSTGPDFCIGVASVSRHGFSYLKETLGSVLQGLDRLERRRIHLVVFLAHANQSQHEDHRQPWLVNMADNLPAYPSNPETRRLVQQLEADSSYEAHALKQKMDYVVLLTECAKVNPKYTMTLEDDVVAVDGWYHRALGALQVATRKTHDLGRDSFLYLRLFYDGRLLGWNAEEWPIYVVYSMAVLLAEVVITAALRWRFTVLRQYLTRAVLLILCGVCTPMLIGLFFAAGRSCMLPRPSGIDLMSRYGCCAQGLVFPQDQVVNHLLPMYRNSQDSHAAVDTFLENWADSRDELRWAVTPVLIQHVGGKSSHGAGDQQTGRLTDDMPFDYSFEMNDPVALAEEHRAWIAGAIYEPHPGAARDG